MPDAGVGHVQPSGIVILEAERHPKRSAGRRVVVGVGEQVTDGAHQRSSVADDDAGQRRGLDRDLLRLAPDTGTELGDGAVHDLLEVDRRPGQLQLSSFDASKLVPVAHRPRQPPDVAADNVEDLALLVGDRPDPAASKKIEVAFDRRERATELTGQDRVDLIWSGLRGKVGHATVDNLVLERWLAALRTPPTRRRGRAVC